MEMATLFTRINNQSGIMCTAGGYGLYHFDMVAGDMGPEPIKILGGKGCDDVFNGIHDHTAFIRSLIMPYARSWPWVFRLA